MNATIEQLTRTPVEARNFPESPMSVQDVRARGYRLQDLWLPSVVAQESAIAHNLTKFADWCREKGVELAPHGKTSMSPQLWERQLEHGAWGMTAANVAQARIMRRYGIKRVLIANEVIDPHQAEWLAYINREADYDYYSLVDSEAGVRLLEHAGSKVGAVLPVLIELGVPGRRTGVRTLDEGIILARTVHGSSHLKLEGVEGYEGVLPQNRTSEDVSRITNWLNTIAQFAKRADEAGLFHKTEQVITTAGGSASPDLAADALRNITGLSRPTRPIIRSGCYVTHDHQSYEQSSPLRSSASETPLVPAMSCYAYVNSVPESGLALIAAGKRDVPVDIDMPIVLRAQNPDGQWYETNGLKVFEVNDHHIFVHGLAASLRVGDLVELGLSHPCTTFDKWRLMPIVDDGLNVIDALVTLF